MIALRRHPATLSGQRHGRIFLEIGLCILLLIGLLPFFILLLNSFKDMMGIAKNILGWPEPFKLSNYTRAFEKLSYPRSFLNTLLVTVLGNAGLIIFGSMAGYRLNRAPTAFNKIVYMLLLASMAIPFEAVMIPLMEVTSTVGLTKSLSGLGICYWGMGASTCIFLTHGAVKGIPYDLEEAAIIDGCGPFKTFWRVIFPLLRTTVVTYTILNTFWFWNDYLMPQLMLGGDKQIYTIQLSMRSLFLEYYAMWDVALAALVISLLPTVIFFLIAQKYILSGLTAGAIKG